ALLSYMMQLPGNQNVRSINPVVGETNDGYLNDIRGRHVNQKDVFEAIARAHGGPVEEGSVGAGAGTVAFGFKGGIGTASRQLPASLGGWLVGVLVQTNFGGILNIDGAPVGRLLGRYYLKNQLHGQPGTPRAQSPDGSCMIIVATNAPVGSRNLRRMAARTMFGLARTGSAASNGSGDYALAFSTVPARAGVARVSNDKMSPLFLAVIEATQEAIYNSLFKATTVTGRDGHTVEALPLAATEKILRQYHVIP
ncbi:MAG: P1 family peptidase, partial [Terriglobales bacterium]